MAFRYYGKNIKSFSAVCGNDFGRKAYTTAQNRIDANNLIQELGKALAIHNQNVLEIEYLDRYYRGDVPALYREKVTRPEINNKVVINLAYELVERKVADMCAEVKRFLGLWNIFV